MRRRGSLNFSQLHTLIIGPKTYSQIWWLTQLVDVQREVGGKVQGGIMRWTGDRVKGRRDVAFANKLVMIEELVLVGVNDV